MSEWKIGIFKYIVPYYCLMAESQCVEMSILAGESQRLMLRINELEEIITELKKEHAEQANIISKQAKLIEELKAKLAKYENPHTPSSAQRYKKK